MFGSSQGLNVRSHVCRDFNRVSFMGATLSLALFASAARGEDDAQVKATRAAAARSLFNEARELMQAGQATKACPKFEESLRLEPGLGTRFNLADCWQAIERNASAWSLFLDVAAEARASGQTERAEVANERARALEPKLSYLVISVESPRDGQHVWLGPVELGRGAWGSRWPVDKGSHQLRAEAPGFESSNQTVRVSAPGNVISVTVPPLDEVTTTAPQPVEAARTTPDAPEPSHELEPPSEPHDNTARAIGLPTLLILGLAGGGLGTYFVIHRNNLNTQAEALCLDSSCSRPEFDRHAQLIADAEAAQTRGIVSFAAGGACLVGAAVWYFLGKDEDPSAGSVSVTGGDGFGLSFRRTF